LFLRSNIHFFPPRWCTSLHWPCLGLAGIRTRLALIASSLLILTLTFGAALNQDWESAGLQLIYATIYASLLAFRHHNTFSVDGLLQNKASKAGAL
jgi:thiosulfate dehydrogenase [quinone] large subunit